MRTLRGASLFLAGLRENPVNLGAIDSQELRGFLDVAFGFGKSAFDQLDFGLF